MGRLPAVVLVGDSVLMDAVAEGLSQLLPAPNLVRFNSCHANLGARCGALGAAIMIFELDASWSDLVTSLLRHQPGTLLIGIDLTCSRLFLLNSSQRITGSMRDLYRVVQREVSRRTGSPPGGMLDEMDLEPGLG